MKILHVITNLGVGGAERALYNLAKELHKKGHEQVVAFFYDGPVREELEQLGVKTHQLKPLIHVYDGSCMYFLYCLIQQYQPSIIHSSLWLATCISRLVAPWCGKVLISDIHGNPEHQGVIRRLLDAATHKCSTIIVPVSHTLAAAYKRSVGAHPWINVIQNGIECHYDSTEMLPLVRPFTIGWVGRFEAIKNPGAMIDISRQLQKECRLTNWEVIMVGDGSMRQKLEEDISLKNLSPHIRCVGLQKDMVTYYKKFDLMIITSYSEGLSLALLEAMSYGIPVISSHDSPQHDVIEHGVNGWLVPPGKSIDYSKIISDCIYNKNYLHKIGASAKATIYQNFALDKQSLRYELLFEQALKNRI